MFLGLPMQMNFISPMLLSTCNRIEIKDIVVDHIKIDEALLDYINANDLEWGYDTILYGQFKNDLIAGNVAGALQIDNLVLKKRKKDEMQWQTVKVLPFDINKNRYNHKDKFVESLETYEYSVQTETSGIYGTENIKEIDTEFDGIWFIGGENTYSITKNIEIGESNNNIVENTVTTLGNKYPFICRNGVINYKTFPVNGLLMSKETEESMPMINDRAEKKYKNNIEKFFNDGKPKIYKDDGGEYFICHVMNPRISYSSNTNRRLYEISCDIVEIGDGYNIDELIENGLLDENEISI